MSLVDTVCIGQFCDSSSLAAMGPANMIKSFATYIFQSLQVATLSLVASNLRDKQRDVAARTLSTALMLAAAFGLLTTVVLSVSASPIVHATGVQDVHLLPLATDYLRIRAVAQPAVLATMVAQAGLLAQQDSVTPSLSVAISVFISILGNLVFVLGLGYGLHGAGVTTVATQMSGALILLWALHSRKSQLQPHWSVPRPQELLTLTQMMVPLTVVSMSKNLCYLCVSTTAATLRTLCLAAHQASFTVWCLGTWSTSPLEQACMTFLPSAEKPWQRKLIGNLVMGLGCIVAAVTGSMLFSLLQFGPGVLVRDLQVQHFMQLIAPQAMISLALVGIDVAATAVNLACRDLTYVARSHLVTLTGICAYFWHCRKYDWGLSGVWWGLVLFFLLRAGQSSLRALWLLRSGRVLAVGSDSMKDENGLPSAAPSPEETPKSKGSSNGGPQAAHQEGPQDTEGASYERPHAVHQEGPGDTEGGENRQPQAVHHEEGRSNGDTKGRNNERPMGAAQEGDPKGTQNGSGCPPGAGHEGGESGPRDAARKGGESGPRDAAMKGGLQ